MCLLLLPSSLSCRENVQAPARQIQEIMTRVAKWQMEHFTYKESGNLHDYGIDAWTNAVLYIGMLKWAQADDSAAPCFGWLMEIGEKNAWAVPANFANYPNYTFYHADELCIGQFYLGMYDKYESVEMLAPIQSRADWIMANPGDSSMNYRNKQSWTWCDALFMAPPVFACLSEITGNPAYVEFMHRNYLRTYRHLFDPDSKLFFRDDSYFGKKEANGSPVFWGRGNGWVIAGIADILQFLPAGAELRPFYEHLFVELASRLSQLQDENGFWHASLLDPQSYPSPETSSTALITYALAYGLNHGLLDDSYRPVVGKAWKALVSVVDEEGKVGWIQPIGADPKKVTSEMTAVYGAGAFLMAGTEMMELMNNQNNL